MGLKNIAEEDEIMEYLTQLMRQGESSREALHAAELIGKAYALFDKSRAKNQDKELTIKVDYGDNGKGK